MGHFLHFSQQVLKCNRGKALKKKKIKKNLFNPEINQEMVRTNAHINIGSLKKAMRLALTEQYKWMLAM